MAIPELRGPVMDDAQILSPSGKQAIDRQIRALMPAAQVQVWTIPSLEGEAIEALAIRAAEKWKLGTKDLGNGVIILVAMKDHKSRIEVGQGIEDRIPDIYARQILAEAMKPQFQAGRYDAGVFLTVQSIGSLMSAARPTSGSVSEKPSLFRRGPRPRVPPWMLLLMLGAAVVVMRLIDRFSGFGATRSSYLRGLGGLPDFRSRRDSGWGGGGWGGGGGGGGWSGGGGGFSGGGSSGGW